MARIARLLTTTWLWALAGCVPSPSPSLSGGEAPPPATAAYDQLDHSQWAIAAINGASPSGGERAELSFAEGRLSGSVGCNRFAGGYSLTDGWLRVGQVMLTRKACPEPLRSEESRVVAALGKGLRLRETGLHRIDLYRNSQDGGKVSIALRRLDFD